MKYALIIPDGVADEPQAQLNGRTPLAAASLPNADEAARLGVVGRTNNVPVTMPSGSDVGIMSLFGYDPTEFHSGRAPLETAAQGIELEASDWAIRCNFITVVDGKITSFTASQIPSNEAAALLSLMQKELPDDSPWRFYPGVSYRNLLVWRDTGCPLTKQTKTFPPHDILNQPLQEYLPQGAGSEQLRHLMSLSREIFAGKASSASQIWLWGEGQRPALVRFQDRFGIRGAIVNAVDLPRGIARLIGWDCVNVKGATGYIDTNYAGKGLAAIAALESGADLVVIHVEGTDEVSHEGNTSAKVEAMENIDRHIIGPVHDYLRETGDYRLLICPDHPTYLRTRTHAHGYCPFAMCGTGVSPDRIVRYDEAAANESALVFEKGHELMAYFLGS